MAPSHSLKRTVTDKPVTVRLAQTMGRPGDVLVVEGKRKQVHAANSGTQKKTALSMYSPERIRSAELEDRPEQHDPRSPCIGGHLFVP